MVEDWLRLWYTMKMPVNLSVLYMLQKNPIDICTQIKIIKKVLYTDYYIFTILAIAVYRPEKLLPILAPRPAGKFLALKRAPLTPRISVLKLAIASSSPFSTPVCKLRDESVLGELHVPYPETEP